MCKFKFVICVVFVFAFCYRIYILINRRHTIINFYTDLFRLISNSFQLMCLELLARRFAKPAASFHHPAPPQPQPNAVHSSNNNKFNQKLTGVDTRISYQLQIIAASWRKHGDNASLSHKQLADLAFRVLDECV